MKTIFSIVAACALLGSTNAWSLTTCEFALNLANLADPGEVFDHKTDNTEDTGGPKGFCTTQVTAKVDKSDPDVTKVDFKIDQSCESGQAQITTISLKIDTNQPIFSCNVAYNNPDDTTEVVEDTPIDTVPLLEALFEDAADATATQFPPGPSEDPLAQALVAALDAAPITCTCFGLNDLESALAAGAPACGAVVTRLDKASEAELRVDAVVAFPSFGLFEANWRDPSGAGAGAGGPRFTLPGGVRCFAPARKFANLCKHPVMDVMGSLNFGEARACAEIIWATFDWVPE